MEQILRTMLIEDEELFLEDLQHKILRTGLSYQIVGCAYDGETALAMMRTLKPDVVLTDIRLPGMDGLELISKWQQEYTETHFVLISGFMDFDYARQAIRLGVEEYLTKPVDIERLTEAFQRLYGKIIKSQHQKQTQYLFSQIYFGNSTIQPYTIFHTSGLYIMHLTVGNHLRYGAKLSDDSVDRDFFTSFSWEDFFEPYFTGSIWIVPGGARNERYLFFCPDGNNSYECAEKIRKAFLMAFPSRHLTVVYDQMPVGFHQIRHRAVRLEEQSIHMLQAWRSGCYSLTSDVPQSQRMACGYNVTNYVHQHLSEKPEVIMQKAIFAAMRAAYMANPSQCQMEMYTISVVSEMQQLFPVHTQALLMTNRTTFAGLVGVSPSFDAFIKSLVQAMTDIYYSRQPQVILESIDLANAARQILDDGYRSSINITQIAKELFVTDSYLIRVFKQKYGISPLQYLINKRMEEAARLLQFTDAQISEVAAAVGYHDTNYFNRLFKKHMGKTPAELRQLFHGQRER